MNNLRSPIAGWILTLLGMVLVGCSDRETNAPRTVMVDGGFWDRIESSILRQRQAEWDRKFPRNSGTTIRNPDDPFINKRPEAVGAKNYRGLLDLAGVPFREEEAVIFVAGKGRAGKLLIFGNDDYVKEVEGILQPFMLPSGTPRD